jgi:hypothetical protein
MDDKHGDIVADAAGSFGRRHRSKPFPLAVATEVWLVTALMHRDHPEAADFSSGEIVARARAERLAGDLRSGFAVHVNQHCVATRRPNPARLRMLVETTPGRRRLFRPGDPYDRRREGGKTMPSREEVPEPLRELIDWYVQHYVGAADAAPHVDPILGLRGHGSEIWDENPDAYVRRLREEWR